MDNRIDLDSIPVIDFGAYSLEKESPDPERLQKLVDEVNHALTTIGFLYLTNTGCPANVVRLTIFIFFFVYSDCSAYMQLLANLEQLAISAESRRNLFKMGI